MNLVELGIRLADIDLGGIDAESDTRLADYFINTPYVDSVTVGRRTLFLGRKGAGKSAVFGQLERIVKEAGAQYTRVVKITPDQYAWSALRDYTEQGILPEQAHANAWKLTLAIEIAGCLADDDVDCVGDAEIAQKALRKFLQSNFGRIDPGFYSAATAVVKNLTSFNLSAFGFGVGAKIGKPNQALTPSIIGTLFDFIGRVAAEIPVIVALDRLDDSWDGSDESRSLLVGLLKAAKDINDRYDTEGNDDGIRVITFLRSDIYDVLTFDDKDKHRPTEQNLVWTATELRDMVQRRLPPNLGVGELFEPGVMRGSVEPFNYMVKRTFLRPREVLQFMQECMALARSDGDYITKLDVRAAENRYSRWKVDDLKQEFSKAIPDFGELLEVFRQEVQRYDSIDELSTLFETKVPALCARGGSRVLLEILLDSSVIGVRLGNSGSPRFKSENLELVLPTSGAVYVHQALTKGLNIREPRKPRKEHEADTRAAVLAVKSDLFERMMGAGPMQDLTWFGHQPKPTHVLENETFAECALALGTRIIQNPEVPTLVKPSTMNPTRFRSDSVQYERLREDLQTMIEDEGLTEEEFLRNFD